jgi:hypothetical protein
MTAGFLAQEHTARGLWGRAFFAGGISSREVFFHAGDEPRRLVVGYADYPRAYRCHVCGAITVPPDGTGETITCLSCGKVIPVGESGCPKCGWSYKAPQDSRVDTPKT